MELQCRLLKYENTTQWVIFINDWNKENLFNNVGKVSYAEDIFSDIKGELKVDWNVP